jgi:hypothetical protein
MAVGPATLDADTPRALDGRDYPEHLRVYEDLDSELLPIMDQVARRHSMTLWLTSPMGVSVRTRSVGWAPRSGAGCRTLGKMARTGRDGSP